ncbi:MAG TPA: GDSL-type esterase/lipase family protein [Streptosporangiaceae bacterium]|nr:GDSL-type esterase/lipase family protein [Streptosporangiaceae bacterium]
MVAGCESRTPAANVSGLRTGRFGRWTDGVMAMREDCAAFASHWQAHNDRVVTGTGPLWVVLGDSTAQGLGAPTPDRGYVGQVLAELRQRTGQGWRVLNLSTSGALIRDVLGDQLPRLHASPDLVTCGIGTNDILYSSPKRLFADLRALVAAVPDETVLLDLPLPAGLWGYLAGSACPTWRGSTGPSAPRPARAACPSPKCPATSYGPGTASWPATTFTPARPATAIGPAR